MKKGVVITLFILLTINSVRADMVWEELINWTGTDNPEWNPYYEDKLTVKKYCFDDNIGCSFNDECPQEGYTGWKEELLKFTLLQKPIGNATIIIKGGGAAYRQASGLVCKLNNLNIFERYSSGCNEIREFNISADLFAVGENILSCEVTGSARSFGLAYFAYPTEPDTNRDSCKSHGWDWLEQGSNKCCGDDEADAGFLASESIICLKNLNNWRWVNANQVPFLIVEGLNNDYVSNDERWYKCENNGLIVTPPSTGNYSGVFGRQKAAALYCNNNRLAECCDDSDFKRCVTDNELKRRYVGEAYSEIAELRGAGFAFAASGHVSQPTEISANNWDGYTHFVTHLNISNNYDITIKFVDANRNVLFSNKITEYIVGTPLLGSWTKVRIPLYPNMKVKSIEFIGKNNSIGVKGTYLGRAEIKFCSNGLFAESVAENIWLSDLDDNSMSADIGAMGRDACNAAGYGWTGTKCCGDDNTEYYTDTEAGCWGGRAVFTGKTTMGVQFSGLIPKTSYPEVTFNYEVRGFDYGPFESKSFEGNSVPSVEDAKGVVITSPFAAEGILEAQAMDAIMCWVNGVPVLTEGWNTNGFIFTVPININKGINVVQCGAWEVSGRGSNIYVKATVKVPSAIEKVFASGSGSVRADNPIILNPPFNSPVPNGIYRIVSIESTGAETFTTSPFYRANNPRSAEHFYTTNLAEIQNAINAGYADEGIEGYLINEQVSATVPFYRLIHNTGLDRVSTANAQEKDNLVQNGWILEGVHGYIIPADASDPSSVVGGRNVKALRRLYNSFSTDHFFTINEAEAQNAISMGYADEGIAGYVLEAASNGTGTTITNVNPDVHLTFESTGTSETNISNERIIAATYKTGLAEERIINNFICPYNLCNYPRVNNITFNKIFNLRNNGFTTAYDVPQQLLYDGQLFLGCGKTDYLNQLSISNENYCTAREGLFCSINKGWSDESSNGATAAERNSTKNVQPGVNFLGKLNSSEWKAADYEYFALWQPNLGNAVYINDSATSNALGTMSNYYEVIAGYPLTVKADIRCTNGEGYLYLEFYDINKNHVSEEKSFSSSSLWNAISITANAPSSARYARVLLSSEDKDNEGSELSSCEFAQVSLSLSGGPVQNIEAIKSGFECCPANRCWDGNKCVANMAGNTSALPINDYRCINGNWSYTPNVSTWDKSQYGYCSRAGQCLVDLNGHPDDSAEDFYAGRKPQCINDEEYIMDYYCSNGIWTTRTREIALAMLKLINESQSANYTVYCDSFDSALPEYEPYLDYIEGQLDPVGARSCFNGTIPCANNFCVMQVDGKRALGVSLNKDIRSFMPAIDKSAGYCSNAAGNNFVKCSNDNKVWYNAHKKLLIYSKEGVNLGSPSTYEWFANMISGFINWLTSSQPNYAGFSYIEKTSLLKKIYVAGAGEKGVTAYQEQVADKAFIFANYRNLSNICIYVNNTGHGIAAGEIMPDLDCEADGKMSNVFTDRKMDVWQDLTSKLRIS